MICSDKLPPLAVVIPCWNAERWIYDAIQSVLDQNYPNIEIIVIDDGSTDGSLEIVRSFGDKICWQTGPNRGACIARNKGLAAVNSDYVLFLDADDWIEGDLLRSMATEAMEDGVDIVFAATRLDRGGQTVAVFDLPQSANEKIILECFMAGRCTQTGAMLWKTSFLRSIGGWNIFTLRDQEIELVFRALVGGGARATAISSGFAIWRQHDTEGRISARLGAAAVASGISFHDSLLPYLDTWERRIQRIFGDRYYWLACEAYYYSANVLGDYAIAQARRLGYKARDRSLVRKLFTPIVGLRAFEFARRTAHLMRGSSWRWM